MGAQFQEAISAICDGRLVSFRSARQAVFRADRWADQACLSALHSVTHPRFTIDDEGDLRTASMFAGEIIVTVTRELTGR